MASIEFYRALLALTEPLENYGQSKAAEGLRKVAQIGLTQRALPAERLVDAISAIGTERHSGVNTNLAPMADALAAFVPFVDQVGSREFVSNFNQLLGELSRLKSMSLRDFLDQLKGKLEKTAPVPSAIDLDDLCSADDFVEALELTVHDLEMFPKVFDRLKQNRAMRRPEVVRIANQFAFPMAKTTTKRAALERIWDQHEAVRIARAKSCAQEGKSAA